MEIPAFQVLLYDVADAVCTLTLNRPARRNALSAQLVNELIIGIETATDDPAVRVIVLQGAGGVFCSGGDLSQMSGNTEDGGLPMRGGFVELNQALAAARKPVIAKVHRYAYGGAIALLCASHFVVAEDTAKFGTPEIDRGVFPMMVMATLFRTLQRRDAIDLILLGERIDAARAAEIGLISRAVPPEALDAAVSALAARLADKPPAVLSLGLEAMRKQDDLTLDEALPYLQQMLVACFGTEDAREGLSAFLQKRKPVWTGR